MEAPNFNIDKVDIKETIIRLRWAKNAWKSDVPSEILSGNSPDIMYKVRKNWWAGLCSHLKTFCLPLLSDETYRDLKKEIQAFLDEYYNGKFISSSGRLTTKEDIDKADALIDKIVSVLENLQNSI